MHSHPSNAVCIVCGDQQRSPEFYRDAFGPAVFLGDTGTCHWLRVGDLAITLRASTDKPSRLSSCEQATVPLFLTTGDSNAAYDRAVAHGARPSQAPQPDGSNFTVADPDGIIIEVMQSEPEVEQSTNPARRRSGGTEAFSEIEANDRHR